MVAAQIFAATTDQRCPVQFQTLAAEIARLAVRSTDHVPSVPARLLRVSDQEQGAQSAELAAGLVFQIWLLIQQDVASSTVRFRLLPLLGSAGARS